MPGWKACVAHVRTRTSLQRTTSGSNRGNMTAQQAEQVRIHPVDLAHITEAVDFIRANDTSSVLAELLPSHATEVRAAISAHCAFSHAAVLVFPHSLTGLREELRSAGLAVAKITPSHVVRDRLSRRYRQPPGAL